MQSLLMRMATVALFLNDRGAQAQSQIAPIATSEVQVLFSESSKEARWTPATGSLLELAEQRGLEPEFSCCDGSCGTCRTTIVKGHVTYMAPSAFHTEPGEALI